MRSISIALTLLCAFLFSSFTTLDPPLDETTPLEATNSPVVTGDVYVTNKCMKKISILLWYNWRGDKWTIDDWVEVAPGETKYLAAAKKDYVYYYAETIDAPMVKWPAEGASTSHHTNHNGKEYNFVQKWIDGRDNYIRIECDDLKTALELQATKSTVANGKGVGLFEEENFSGPSSALAAGKYDYNKLGISNNKLSSIQVPNGWSIKIFKNNNWNGSNKTYTGNINSLPGIYTNNISSVIVKDNNSNSGNSSGNPGSSGGSGSSNAGNSGSSGSIYKVHIKNNCVQPVTVYIHKIVENTTTNEWETVGPHIVQPDQEFYAENTSNGNVYYHAEMGPLTWPPLGETGNRSFTYENNTYQFSEFEMQSLGPGKRVITLNCLKEKAQLNKNNTFANVSNGEGVGMFEKGNYGGETQILAEGKYKDFTNLGIPNNKLGSIRIPDGWSVTVYSLQYLEGTSKKFTRSIASLDLNWRDRVYSVEVKNNNAKKSNGNETPKETKRESASKNTGKTERISLNLRSGKPFTVEVSSVLTPEVAWERVRSVVSPNGFMKRDVDNTFQTLTTDWKAFPRENNTIRVKVIMEKAGSESYPEYKVTFLSEESGAKDTSVYEDVKFKSTQMLPVECDKFLSDLQRKLGDR